MVHTPLVLTGETRETQEKHTPAKVRFMKGAGFTCSLFLILTKNRKRCYHAV